MADGAATGVNGDDLHESLLVLGLLGLIPGPKMFLSFDLAL